MTADEWGFGAASVRFICGTQGIHKTLEQRVSRFLGMEDTILYAACFDANTGLFETILGPEDAVISDELNHASIIDGVRLCKASRYRYRNNDMADLEAKLVEARDAGARRILITTDGVFSMDGTIAQLDAICDLADQYGAMVHHDDCHATGFMGDEGRGVHEYRGVMDQVGIITGTFGKALGGGSGGLLLDVRRLLIFSGSALAYLFSNTRARYLCCRAEVLDMLESSTALRDRLHDNTRYFREQVKRMVSLCQKVTTPLSRSCWVMQLSRKNPERLLELGIYAIGFFYPVVPQGKARIRVQISAGHTRNDLDKAVAAFATAVEWRPELPVRRFRPAGGSGQPICRATEHDLTRLAGAMMRPGTHKEPQTLNQFRTL